MTPCSRLSGILCVAVLAASQTTAQAVLSPEQLRELSGQAVLQGQARLAYDLSVALVDLDDEDLNAHLIRSRPARVLCSNADALIHARRAWTLSETEAVRYASALAVPQALSSSGRRTAA